MFSQLFFLLLALTLMTFSPEEGQSFWIQTPQEAFQWSMWGYVALLILLLGESKYLASFLKGRFQTLWWSLVNLQILIFLGLYHFGLGGERFLLQGSFASYQTFNILYSLFLYLLALA